MKVGKLDQQLNSGSRWRRWEPHIHAPGTVLNDQFKGADSWECYLKALEAATPPIRAIRYQQGPRASRLAAGSAVGGRPSEDHCILRGPARNPS